MRDVGWWLQSLPDDARINSAPLCVRKLGANMFRQLRSPQLRCKCATAPILQETF